MTRRSLLVSSFYRFFPLAADEIPMRKLALETRAARLEIDGLVILAEEGCNGTVVGTSDSVELFEQTLPVLFGDGDWMFKRAFAIRPPFQDFRVKVRAEIVTTRTDDPLKVSGSKNHLTPTEWQALLDSGEELTVLDTRNRYETRLGMFRGAVDPKIDHFSDFAARLPELQMPKDRKVLIYCTGGIRCEKAILEMERQGYERVYQLEGGILRYLEHFPHKSFEGECFVFDGRVAVDQSLSPSRAWSLCPHCGDPAHTAVSCQFCERPTKVCEECLKQADRNTCSQDCAYRLRNQHPRRIANG